MAEQPLVEPGQTPLVDPDESPGLEPLPPGVITRGSTHSAVKLAGQRGRP